MFCSPGFALELSYFEPFAPRDAHIPCTCERGRRMPAFAVEGGRSPDDMTTPDSALLLQRIAGGDDAALQQLYVEYRPRLRRYLWHQLDGATYTPEEALQGTFLAVGRTAAASSGAGHIASSLSPIAPS